MKASRKRPATARNSGGHSKTRKAPRLASANITTETSASSSRSATLRTRLPTVASEAVSTRLRRLRVPRRNSHSAKRPAPTNRATRGTSAASPSRPTSSANRPIAAAISEGTRGSPAIRSRRCCRRRSRFAAAKLSISDAVDSTAIGGRFGCGRWRAGDLSLQPVADGRIAQKIDEGFDLRRRLGRRSRLLGQARNGKCGQEDGDGKQSRA